jgi:hypothetical protein
MNTATNNPVIEDAIPNKLNTSLMIAAALEVLLAGMYPFKICDEQTLAQARYFIRGFVFRNEHHYANYAEFCQRILMARHYAEKNSWYVHSCSLLCWLDPDNKKGFAGTAAWYATLQDKRSILPLHLLELKAFPEALLEMAEEPGSGIFRYWNNWFIERNATDAALMFRLVSLSMAYPETEKAGG